MEEVKQILIQEYTKEWIKKHPELYRDIEELCEMIVSFNKKWGSGFILVDNFSKK